MIQKFSEWLLVESTQGFSEFCNAIINAYPHEDNAVMVSCDYLSEEGQDNFSSCLRVLYGQRLDKLSPSFLARLFGQNAIKKQSANQIFSFLKTNLQPLLNSRKQIFPIVDENYRLIKDFASQNENCGITFIESGHENTVTLAHNQHFYFPNQDAPGSKEVNLDSSQLPIDAKIDLFFAIIKSRMNPWFIGQTERRI